MELWLGAFGLLGVIGLALVVLGLRGRRIDGHPLCRRCGFDLFGGRRWETRECPECGADVSGLAVRVGHRKIRADAVYGGLTLLVPATLMLSAAIYVEARGIDLTASKPTWWLTYELSGTDASLDRAFIELSKRFQANLLTDYQIGNVVDYCLDNQQSRGGRWSAGWGAFVEASRSAGKLKEERWARYATQSLRIEVRARSPVLAAEGLSMTAVVTQSRLSAVSFDAPLELSDVRIDGVPVKLQAIAAPSISTTGTIALGNRQRTATYTAIFDRDAIRQLSPGNHEITVVAAVVIRADGGKGPEIANLRHDTRVPFEVVPPR